MTGVIDFGQAGRLFQRAAARVVETCSPVSEQVWCGGTDGHRICDIVEHMAISNGLFARRLEAMIAAPPHGGRCSQLEDDEVPFLFERAVEPPGLAEPTGTWINRNEAVERYGKSARAFIELSARAVGDMRSKGSPHPLFGTLDGVQWIIFAAAHNERHRSEIIGLLG